MSALRYVRHTKPALSCFAVSFVLLVVNFSIFDPVIISATCRTHEGPLAANVTFNVAGSVGPDMSPTFNAAGVIGGEIVAARTLLNAAI
jgi:hypothetical protein